MPQVNRHLWCGAGWARTLHSGTTTANGFDSCPSIGGRAREHRELNRRDNPRDGSGKRGSQHPLRPAARPVDGNRKPGRVHAWGRGAQCRCGKAPPSRSDRPPQGGRERVGRGSLQAAFSNPTRTSSSGSTDVTARRSVPTGPSPAGRRRDGAGPRSDPTGSRSRPPRAALSVHTPRWHGCHQITKRK